MVPALRIAAPLEAEGAEAAPNPIFTKFNQGRERKKQVSACLAPTRRQQPS